jgi:hypothetical protein
LGRGVNIRREERISPEKEFDVFSVAVWMGSDQDTEREIEIGLTGREGRPRQS